MTSDTERAKAFSERVAIKFEARLRERGIVIELETLEEFRASVEMNALPVFQKAQEELEWASTSIARKGKAPFDTPSFGDSFSPLQS